MTPKLTINTFGLSKATDISDIITLLHSALALLSLENVDY